MPETQKNCDNIVNSLRSTEMTTRMQKLDHWLSKTVNTKGYQLQSIASDASFRHYFRLQHDGRSYMVMDAPPAREDCRPFIDIAERLLAADINVPRIIARDPTQGFLLLSDLGDQDYLTELNKENISETDIATLYKDAMQVLLQLHSQINTAGLPPYDKKLLLQEMDLFRYWLLEKHIGLELTATTHAMLDDLFALLADVALTQPRVFVHRDYHTRNLMLDSNGKLGILDFQDAVYGPLTYDLVSLLKDCYIKWPTQQIISWTNQYFTKLAQQDIDIERDQFMYWFDLMGVQRHLKASGIFARLHLRDGKSGYLKDIPRTLSYIIELGATHPELAGIITLIKDQIIPVISEAKE